MSANNSFKRTAFGRRLPFYVKAMREITLLLAALSFSPEIMACDIVGTWQSDASATMLFNRTNARLEEHQDRFLADLMGKMTLEFTDKQLHLRMPDIQVTVKGESTPFDGFEERHSYKILFCNSHMAVIETTEAVTGEDDVAMYFFVDPDTMWVYTGTNKQRVPDLHLREYFKRIR